MIALINPRIWIAMALVAILSFTHFYVYRAGKANMRASWNAAIVVQQQNLAIAEKASRDREQALQHQKDEAVNAAAKRTQQAEVALAASRRTANSLRDDLAAARAELPRASIESLRARVTALTDVFGECTTEITELAGQADRISVERDTLINAWPK